MSKISYIEDKNLMAYCVQKKDFGLINRIIEQKKEQFNYSIKVDESILAFDTIKISPLVEIYNSPFFAVNFAFKNVSNTFCKKKQEKYLLLLNNLYKQIIKQKGYYIIKIPIENVNLLSSFNLLKMNTIFTGGTVCYFFTENKAKVNYSNNIEIHVDDKNIINYLKNEIVSLCFAAFENYFGQYHIATYTRNKAPLIYKNWIKRHIENEEAHILLATFKNKLAGFLSIVENQYTVETVLAAVDSDFRGKRIFERMIAHFVKIALRKKKISTYSTQFSNYIVQRALTKIGFKPYHGFYLFHFNNLNN